MVCEARDAGRMEMVRVVLCVRCLIGFVAQSIWLNVAIFHTFTPTMMIHHQSREDPPEGVCWALVE